MAKRKDELKRAVFSTRLSLDDAWDRITAISHALGLEIEATTPKQEIHFDLSRERPGLYWVIVILGFIIYIIPGLYALWYYRTTKLILATTSTPSGTLVCGQANTKDAWQVFDQFRHCLADNLVTVDLSRPLPISNR
jgi:hypothetical protein